MFCNFFRSAATCSHSVFTHFTVQHNMNGSFSLSKVREGKVERINRQPIFSTVSCGLPSLITGVLRALHWAELITADSGKNWLSINSLCLTLTLHSFPLPSNQIKSVWVEMTRRTMGKIQIALWGQDIFWKDFCKILLKIWVKSTCSQFQQC